MFWISTPGGIYRRSIDLRKSLLTHFNAMSTHRGEGEKREKRNKDNKDDKKLIPSITGWIYKARQWMMFYGT